MSRLTNALLWVDLEATGLPEGHNFSKVEIIEVGAILTDRNLTRLSEIEGVVTPHPEMVAALKDPANAEATQMHKNSGLLAALKGDTQSLESLETEILEAIDEFVTETGTVVLAGSGIAMYDFPLIKEKMPRLAKRLAYFPFDIGVARRVNLILSNNNFRVPNDASHGEAKLHRAFADVSAHVQEARQVMALFNVLYGVPTS